MNINAIYQQTFEILNIHLIWRNIFHDGNPIEFHITVQSYAQSKAKTQTTRFVPKWFQFIEKVQFRCPYFNIFSIK